MGGSVVPRLVARGHVVSALARSPQAAARAAALGATPVVGDLDDSTSLDEAFTASRAQALVNLASLGFGHATAIVAAAEEAGLERAVFVSTTAVFTTLDPSSKSVRLAAEETVRSSALDWTIVRPTMIYGTPADRNMARLLRLVRRSPVVPLPGGGKRLQQPVHLDDIACAIVTAAETRSCAGREYNMAGPEPLTLRQAVVEAAAALGRSPRLVAVPLAPVRTALQCYERVVRHPRLSVEQLQRLGEDKSFDISAAGRDLGFAPRSFRAGITQEAAMLW